MMRRMMLLVTVALVMAAMMAFGAGAASAQERSDQVEFVEGTCIGFGGQKLFTSVVLVPAAPSSGGPVRCAGPPL